MDKILLIDDEEEMRRFTVKLLHQEGMKIETLAEGWKALQLLKEQDFDLILLDLHLGDMDGFDLLQEIRQKHPALPVLILSARKESYNKVLGFGLGADDYITKPFNNEEFIARIKGNIRRSRIRESRPGQEEILHCACFRLDRQKYILYKNDQPLELPSRLIKLMAFFMESPDRVFTKEQIYNHVWDDHFFDEQTVIVYIRKLRQTIEADSKQPKYLETVRGVGYKLNSMEKKVD